MRAEEPPAGARAWLTRVLAGDLMWSLKRSPLALAAALLLVLIVLASFFAPWIAPQNPYDLKQLFLDRAELPPWPAKGGEWPYLLGTDNQGRDVLSAILYGSRVSLVVGAASVALAMTIGVSIGLIAGYHGRLIDNLLMRIGDTVLSIPTLLVAILVSALFRRALPPDLRDTFSAVILIVAIALTGWVQYARIVRASTLVERRKEYVLAARIIGVGATRIMRRHILPNTLTPVLVAATLNLGLAILSEATLSFLGVGMPVTQPSLGTLIRFGQQYLMSGEWWILLFPALTIVILGLAINLLGDWLRDAMNPKLR